MDQGNVRHHANNYAAHLSRIGSPRRSSALPWDQIDQIVLTILQFFEERRPLTLAEIGSIVTDKFKRMIQADTLLPFSTEIPASIHIQPTPWMRAIESDRRANKLEKVNLQTSHIVTILDSFMPATVPQNVTAAFCNGGISLAIEGNRTRRCSIAPATL
jgi:hypothetical protein